MRIEKLNKELETTFEKALSGDFNEKLEAMHKSLHLRIAPRLVVEGLKVYTFGVKTFANILFNSADFESVLKSMSIPDDFYLTKSKSKTVNITFTDDVTLAITLPTEHFIYSVGVGNKKLNVKGQLLCLHNQYQGRISYDEHYFGNKYSIVNYLKVNYLIRSIKSPITQGFISCLEKGKITIKQYIDARLAKLSCRLKTSDYKFLQKCDYELKIYFLLFLYTPSLKYYIDRKSYLNNYYGPDEANNKLNFKLSYINRDCYDMNVAKNTLKFLEAME